MIASAGQELGFENEGDPPEAVRISYASPIAEISLARAPVNAITPEVYQALTTAFDSVSQQPDIHAVVLRSALPSGFCAGVDMKQALTASSRQGGGARRHARLARQCYEAILDCAQPTIAAVHGYALGAGAVLAACCDIRLAGESARIGLPEINAGRCGGGRHLMRLIPQGRMRLMYFTGEPMDAQEALRLDLVQAVHPDAELHEAARGLAAKIAGKSPLGLRLAKRALNEAEAMDLRSGYYREQQYTLELTEHPDAREAMLAILEKRAPVWNWGTGANGREAEPAAQAERSYPS